MISFCKLLVMTVRLALVLTQFREHERHIVLFLTLKSSTVVKQLPLSMEIGEGTSKQVSMTCELLPSVPRSMCHICSVHSSYSTSLNQC